MKYNNAMHNVKVTVRDLKILCSVITLIRAKYGSAIITVIYNSTAVIKYLYYNVKVTSILS